MPFRIVGLGGGAKKKISTENSQQRPAYSRKVKWEKEFRRILCFFFPPSDPRRAGRENSGFATGCLHGLAAMVGRFGRNRFWTLDNGPPVGRQWAPSAAKSAGACPENKHSPNGHRDGRSIVRRPALDVPEVVRGEPRYHVKVSNDEDKPRRISSKPGNSSAEGRRQPRPILHLGRRFVRAYGCQELPANGNPIRLS